MFNLFKKTTPTATDKLKKTEDLIKSVDYSVKCSKIDDKYIVNLYLDTLPVNIYQSSIQSILDEDDFTCRIAIKYENPLEIKNRAGSRKNILVALAEGKAEKGFLPNQSVINEIKEIDILLSELETGMKKTFLFQFKIALVDTDKKILLAKAYALLERVRIYGWNFNLTIYKNQKHLPNLLPTGIIDEGLSQLVYTDEAKNLIPFTSKMINHKNGIFYGVDYFSNTPIVYNFFSQTLFNFNVLGESGGGKSTTVKNIIWNERFKEFSFVIIDPENEYLDLAKEAGDDANVFKFSRSNPLNILGIPNYVHNSEWAMEQRQDQISALKKFFSLFIDPANYGTGNDIGDMLSFYYDQYLPKGQDYVNLETFLGYIEENYKDDVRKRIVNDLQVFRNDREFGGYFNGKQFIEVNKPITVFALQEVLGQDLISAAALIIISQMMVNISRNREKRIMLVVDEAHKFFNNKSACAMLVDFAATARKRRMGLGCITQNITDFNARGENHDPSKILVNAQTTIILRQSAGSIEQIRRSKSFDLSENEIAVLAKDEPGVGVIYREEERAVIKFIILPTVWNIAQTTNAKDYKLKEKSL